MGVEGAAQVGDGLAQVVARISVGQLAPQETFCDMKSVSGTPSSAIRKPPKRRISNSCAIIRSSKRSPNDHGL
jgi:hypothetical protein